MRRDLLGQARGAFRQIGVCCGLVLWSLSAVPVSMDFSGMRNTYTTTCALTRALTCMFVCLYVFRRLSVSRRMCLCWNPKDVVACVCVGAKRRSICAH
eukprot:6177623-Pleurochrysis_carterae.AAC.1